MASFSIPQFSGRGRRETLADYLAAGPPSLTSALHCATAIAGALRDLHEEGRSHGSLTATAILLSDSGTTLQLLSNHQSQAPLHADVQAFGSILNELMIRSVAADGGVAGARLATSRSSPLGIRAAGARLAGRCMAAKRDTPGIQQALTEVRLLYVMARQNEADAAGGQAPAAQIVPAAQMAPAAPARFASAPVTMAPASPFLVNPQPKAAPVVHAPKPAALQDLPEVAPVVPLQAANFGRPQHHASSESERAEGKCPKCESADVYVSRPRSKFENLLVRWKFPLCRCHRCYHRWVTILRMRIGKDMPVGTKGRSFKKGKKVHRRH